MPNYGHTAICPFYMGEKPKTISCEDAFRKLAKIIGIEAGDLYAAFKGTKPMHPKYKRLISEALGESEDNLFNEEA